jgi:VWFA-related protein
MPLLRSLGLLALAAFGAQQSPPQQQPQTPTFRAGTRLVPVDVRVVDRSGKPVTDLTERDFVILENGIRQQLSHFSAQALAADTTTPSRLWRHTDPAPPIGSQTNRIFLIVLGRGHLQPPARGVDGMIHFVKDRLLPQDIVGVMAWNRATDFTTDHTKVVQVLERFKKEHEKIESLLAHHFSGLAAIYGSKEIPPHLQGAIDGVFAGPAGTGLRSVAETDLPTARRMAEDRRRVIDAMQRAELNANRSGSVATTEIETTLGGPGFDLTLDELASITAQSTQDVAKITAGIQYLRYLHGEKHLIFVSPSGVFLPRADDDRSLAALASDARVALDIVHTGGLPAAPGGRGGGPDWRRATSQTVAIETGGSYSSLSMARDFVDRLDASTRFQYTLGYYPANSTLDGRFRRIVVRVTRPGLQVLYRHGYFATRELPPLDRRKLLTYNRVSTAATLARAIGDIALQVTATNGKDATGAPEVAVQIRIPPDRLAFTDTDGRKKGAIEVAIFCADGRERLIGQSWNAVDLEMTPEAFQRFMASGLTYNGRVAVAAAARHVKVVVYDYGADLIGSAMVQIK